MPIGSMQFPGREVTAEALRKIYDDLISEALLKARSDLEIVRADDLPSPGDVTAEIFERISDSDYVVADITYPNPNVFYELGLRHATRTGTILLRERGGPKPPFDISVLRHIEYENTPTGLKQLANDLDRSFDYIEQHPGRPDNPFLRVAEPRFVLPAGGKTYQVLQVGEDGKPVWGWVRAHG
jgi:hypothetical protein